MSVHDTEHDMDLVGRRVVVTGAAGFIGSSVVDRLLELGADVVGIDMLDPWYAVTGRRRNLDRALEVDRFRFIEADLATSELTTLFDRAHAVVHLAARPGVQDSWGPGFAAYARNNVLVTQHVMEAALECGVLRVVNASSSSVYGETAGAGNARRIAPTSPYGVSKAAAEQLADVYAGRGLDVVSLRYFTVYGPRQRPDMAMHRLFAATDSSGPLFVLRGDGRQRREFTHIDDIVDATIRAAMAAEQLPAALDIGGGEVSSLRKVIGLVSELAGHPVRLRRVELPPGDPTETTADIEPAAAVLGWAPRVGLRAGLFSQWRWHQAVASTGTLVD